MQVNDENFTWTELKDMFLKPISVGDNVVRSGTGFYPGILDLCVVTSIKNGKVYLNNHQNPVNFPGRLLVINALL